MAAPPKESQPPAVLIVDDDLGFLVWLGLTLGNGGFVTVPATSGVQAKEVIDELGIRINLAIVNLTLPGALELGESLRRRDKSVKVIAIQNADAASSATIKIDAAHNRSKLGWVTLVRKTLGIEKATGAR
jgi:DNA-binding response OmpR family regulator